MAATSLGSGGRPVSQSFVAYEISMNFIFPPSSESARRLHPSRLRDIQIDKSGAIFTQLFFSSPRGAMRSGRSLPTRQLGDLNEVAAGVVQFGDGRAGAHRSAPW